MMPQNAYLTNFLLIQGRYACKKMISNTFKNQLVIEVIFIQIKCVLQVNIGKYLFSREKITRNLKKWHSNLIKMTI